MWPAGRFRFVSKASAVARRGQGLVYVQSNMNPRRAEGVTYMSWSPACGHAGVVWVGVAFVAASKAATHAKSSLGNLALIDRVVSIWI